MVFVPKKVKEQVENVLSLFLKSFLTGFSWCATILIRIVDGENLAGTNNLTG